MARENGMNTGLECRDVGIRRAGNVYKHYTNM